jgi:hypothetical protein
MTQLIDICRVSCNKQGWVFPAGENDSRNVLSGEIAGPDLRFGLALLRYGGNEDPVRAHEVRIGYLGLQFYLLHSSLFLGRGEKC